MKRLSSDKCIWGSNPSRVKYFTQEIVIFRDDLLNRCRRNLIAEPISINLNIKEGEMENDSAFVDERKHVSFVEDISNFALMGKGSSQFILGFPFHSIQLYLIDFFFLLAWLMKLAQTILDQSHLSPFSIEKRPIYWDFDHSLRLYPLPHTVSVD